MKCPYCNQEMRKGSILFARPWGPGAFYPDQPNDSKVRALAKKVFGSKDAVCFAGADESWHCGTCKKIVAILRADSP